MKLKYKTALTIFMLFAFALSHAQILKPLKIGDKVPDVYFSKMLNHKATDGRLSDFVGKAIIIDVWFKECSPCIGAMKHLDSLQQEFKNDLQILPVTWQSKKDIENLWKKDKDLQGIVLTQAVEDTTVLKLFPAVSFPHQIWIDKDRTVLAITDGNNASHENIKKLIMRQNVKIAVKKDEMDARVRYAIEPNMVIRYEENKDKILYYSYFSTYRKEFTGMAKPIVDTLKQQVRITANNFPLLHLYNFAYTNNSGETFHFPTRMIRRDHNPIKSLNTYDTTSLFCYDLIYKGKSAKEFSKHMIPDLDKFFGVESHEESLDITCYVISPNGKGTRFRDGIYPNEKRVLYNVVQKKGVELIANKQWPSWLEYDLNQYSDNLLLVEMSKEKLINFKVVWNLDDLKSMNKELKNYDLKIEKARRKRNVIILDDAK